MREERLYEQVVVEISGTHDEWSALRDLTAGATFGRQITNMLSKDRATDAAIVTMTFSGTRGEIHKLRALANKVAREREASVS